MKISVKKVVEPFTPIELNIKIETADDFIVFKKLITCGKNSSCAVQDSVELGNHILDVLKLKIVSQ